MGKKITVKVWINVYKRTTNDDGSHPAEFIGFTERYDGDPDRIACIEREITYEPGEGL